MLSRKRPPAFTYQHAKFKAGRTPTPCSSSSSSSEEEDQPCLIKSRHELLQAGMIDRLHDEMEYHLAGLGSKLRTASRLSNLNDLVTWIFDLGSDSCTLLRAHGLLDSMGKSLLDLTCNPSVAEALILIAAWLGQSVRDLGQLIDLEILWKASLAFTAIKYEEYWQRTKLPVDPAEIRLWLMTRLDRKFDDRIRETLLAVKLSEGMDEAQVVRRLLLWHRLKMKEPFQQVYNRLSHLQNDTLTMALMYLTEISAEEPWSCELNLLCYLIPNLEGEAQVYGVTLLTNLVDRDADQCDQLRLEPAFLQWLAPRRDFYSIILLACCLTGSSSCRQLLLGIDANVIVAVVDELEVPRPQLSAEMRSTIAKLIIGLK